MKNKQTSNISPIKKYRNLYIACQQYPEIQLQPYGAPIITVTTNPSKIAPNGFIKKFVYTNKNIK